MEKVLTQIDNEVAELPKDQEMIRSAFNMSTTTTGRLKNFATKHKIPLQSLVELAVINLLDQYSKR